MVHSYQSKPQIIIKPGFCILIGFLMLLLPLKWLSSWIIAAAVHEISHYILLKIFHCPVYAITVDICGARIDADTLTDLRECLCAAAGPLSGILLVCFGRLIPTVAVCAFFQTAFNLLPITGFDGGRILHFSVCTIFSPRHAQLICHVVELFSAVAIMVIAVILTFVFHVGTLPLMIAAAVLLRIKPLKIPCKHRQQIVQ